MPGAYQMHVLCNFLLFPEYTKRGQMSRLSGLPALPRARAAVWAFLGVAASGVTRPVGSSCSTSVRPSWSPAVPRHCCHQVTVRQRICAQKQMNLDQAYRPARATGFRGAGEMAVPARRRGRSVLCCEAGGVVRLACVPEGLTAAAGCRPTLPGPSARCPSTSPPSPRHGPGGQLF